MKPNQTITIGAIIGGIWGVLSALARVGTAMADGTTPILWQILTLPASLVLWLHSSEILPEIPVSAPAWTAMAYVVIIGVILGAIAGYLYDRGTNQ